VTKLQTALGFTPEQVATLPPPLVKIRELELENGRLNKEIEELRRVLDPTGRGRNSMESNRRESLVSFHDSRLCDRDYKRRKMNGGVEEVYMVSTLFFAVIIISCSLSTSLRTGHKRRTSAYHRNHLPTTTIDDTRASTHFAPLQRPQSRRS
jgi:hypothetical protein